MAEEFQESEVIFQENAGDEEDNEKYNFPGRNMKAKRKKFKKNSVPVNIPENITGSSWTVQYVDSEIFDDENDGGEMVPPHVIVGRRVDEKMMAFSVCTGNGRTLKGRDLSEVRNSILKMTGFLET
ncbi:unnamed protein product [Fraxinus pennsylvanica]|uniref:Senescence regulator n=1 Tax=Fraxinus pennsylvanica TaxID=56036 RepID=A0AAD1ZPR9_9LAMI|nr:unnamed protein product [Fraxinus pennsylvanica]